MPSLPQAAFATCKIRSQHHHQYSEQNTTTAWKYRNNDNKNTKQNKFQNFPNEKLLEYTPVKYNSKLMNSIWGLYNRYSPHNIKGNDDDELNSINKQLSITVASYIIASNTAIMLKNLSNDEWNFNSK